jgi:small subunit ribosomal protein S16
MLKMRLQRVGRTHEPTFRLVLTESENATKSGRFKEILGSYDPRKTTELLKGERILHWLSKGVLTTPSVNNLLVKKGIIRGKKVDVSAGEGVPLAPAVEAVEAPVEAPTLEAEVEVTPEPVVETAPIEAEAVPEAAPAPEPTPEVVPAPATEEEKPTA